jgi:hypothetical protein
MDELCSRRSPLELPGLVESEYAKASWTVIGALLPNCFVRYIFLAGTVLGVAEVAIVIHVGCLLMSVKDVSFSDWTRLCRPGVSGEAPCASQAERLDVRSGKKQL